MESDQTYFAQRAAEERQHALVAASQVARLAHHDMASRYEILALEIERVASPRWFELAEPVFEPAKTVACPSPGRRRPRP